MPDPLPAAIWDGLDPDAEPCVRWFRKIPSGRAVLLLGAFDPPTNAHVDVLRAAVRAEGVPGAFCLTKVLLDRPGDDLLPPAERIDLLDRVGAREGFGVVLANRGTYIDVARAFRAAGLDPSFVIGSDKLAQLSDPVFYPDGTEGVHATFDELRFLVVPRPPAAVDRDDVVVLSPDDVFAVPAAGGISASEVRRRIRDGAPVVDLVPPEVARAVQGYTRPT